MYAVEVREHIMIAHSFSGKMFGPAQALHGATFVVDACFFSETLDDNNVVIDIGAAHEALQTILAPLNYKNLDEIPQFAGENTTTEFLCRHIWKAMANVARGGGLGREGGELAALKITLHESHVAKAWFEASLNPS